MKPILFNTYMVQAILDGRKTMTRRVVKPQPLWIGEPNVPFKTQDADHNGIINSPYQPGDILYVRETWKCTKYNSMDGDLGYEVEFMDGSRKYFEFDDNERFHEFGKYAFKNGWRPSIFMPKEVARIFLEVTNVRVERLQEITEEDAIKEGCINESLFNLQDCRLSAKHSFHKLWDTIAYNNDKTRFKTECGEYMWKGNPWVWVYEFKRVEVQA